MHATLLLASVDPEELIKVIGHWIAFLGVAVIVAGILFAAVMMIREIAGRSATSESLFRNCRHRVGRGLILGLEILVAADIVETVALEPTFTNIGVLALIVLVRTFLGWTLVLELEGRWPWQKEA